MSKEINFEAIRATDKALDEIWINALFAGKPGDKRKLFVDMRTPEDAADWNVFRDTIADGY